MALDPSQMQAGAFAQFILDYRQLIQAREEIPRILQDVYSRSEQIVQRYLAEMNRLSSKAPSEATVLRAQMNALLGAPEALREQINNLVSSGAGAADPVLSALMQRLDEFSERWRNLIEVATGPEARRLSVLLPETLRQAQMGLEQFLQAGGMELVTSADLGNAAQIVSLMRQYNAEMERLNSTKQIFLRYLQGEIAAQRAIANEEARRQLSASGAVKTSFGFVLPETARRLQQLGLWNPLESWDRQVEQTRQRFEQVFTEIQTLMQDLASRDMSQILQFLPDKFGQLYDKVLQIRNLGRIDLLTDQEVRDAQVLLALHQRIVEQQQKRTSAEQVYSMYLEAEMRAQQAIAQVEAQRLLARRGFVSSQFGMVSPQTAERLQQLGILTKGVGTEASGVLSTFSKFAGALLPAIGVATTLTGVMFGVVRAVRSAVSHAIEFFDTIKLSVVFLRGFTGSFEEASATFSRLVQYARESKAPLSDILDSARQLAPVLAAAGESVEALPYYLDVARKLAVLNMGPTGGIGGAIFSISEMLSGDVRSIQRRFRINTDILKRIAEEQGLTYIQALDKFLTENLGITDDVVRQSMETISTSMKSLSDSLGYLFGVTFRPLAEDVIIPIAQALSETTTAAADFLDTLQRKGAGWDDFVKSALSLKEGSGGLVSFFTDFGEAVNTILLYMGALSGRSSFAERNLGLLGTLKASQLQEIALMYDTAKDLSSIYFGLYQAYLIAKGVLLEAARSFLEVLLVIARGLGASNQAIANSLRTIDDLSERIRKNNEEYQSVLEQEVRARKELDTEAKKAIRAAMEFNKGMKEVAETISQSPVLSLSDELRSFINFRRRVDEEALNFEERRADLLRESVRELEDLERDHLERMKQIDDQYFEQKEKREKDFIESYTALLEGREGRVASLLERVEIERRFALIEFQEKEAELTKEHYRRLRELQKEYHRNIQEAAARLDAIAVVNAQQQYRDRVREENRNYRDRLKELRKQFDEEWTITSKAFQRRLEIAREYDRRRAEELKAQYEEQQREAEEDWKKRKALAEKEYRERLALINKQAAEEWRRLHENHQRRLEEINRAFTEEILALEGHYAEMYQIQQTALQQIEDELEKWWQENADKYIPPYLEKKTSDTPMPPMGHYQSGGYVPRTGLYVLHAGEIVIPSSVVQALKGSSITPVPTSLVWNGNLVLENAGSMSAQEIRMAVEQALVDAFTSLARS
ncbi:MAG: hypothetical protein QXS68_03100 [Candidatus Methanomethylicaceae archaeon]